MMQTRQRHASAVRSIALVLVAAAASGGCADPALDTSDQDEAKAARQAISLPTARVMPQDIAEARAEQPRRVANIVRMYIQRYIEDGSFDVWRPSDNRYSTYRDDLHGIRKIAAGLFALQYPQRFPEVTSALGGKQAFVAAARQYIIDNVKAFKPVGTTGSPREEYERDYDMYLRELLTLLLSFHDRPDLLDNEMVWQVLCQDGAEGGCNDQGENSTGYFSFAGQSLNKQAWLGHYGPITIGYYSETENHTLMIHSWRYIVNDYVRWVAGLPSNHPRFDIRIKRLHDLHPEAYNNEAGNKPLLDYVLQMLARPLHLGMFEENAKPYESLSLHAIMNLYLGANLFFDSDGGRKVKAAAQNALEFLATKFAFQSFEGKRLSPFRRNYDNRRRWGIGNNDYVIDMMAMLSGAYVFDDGWNDSVSFSRSDGLTYYRSRYYHKQYAAADAQNNGYEVSGGMNMALWTAMFQAKTAYSLPPAIHDFMLNKRSGYWARMTTPYTTAFYGKDQDPRYFISPTATYDGGALSSSPEFYFATRDFLNSSGGYASQYYPRTLGIDEKNVYNWISVPSTVLPKGDVGRSWGRQGNNRTLVSEDIATMIGNVSYEHESKNSWTYKNFSYGYRHNESGSDFHLTWPQYYPSAWNAFATPEFSIGRAVFKIIDLRNVSTGAGTNFGYYLVMARVSKSDSGGQYREYGRGFWEIVPGAAFNSVAEVKAAVIANNPASFYNDSTSGDSSHYHYKLVTSGDKLRLDRKVGSSDSCQAIMAIWDHNGNQLDVKREHTNNCKSFPDFANDRILEVRGVDDRFRFTGDVFANATGDGRVVVTNPFNAASLTLDGVSYLAPGRGSSETSTSSDGARAYYTPWMNRDAPSGNGDGEHLGALLQEGYPACAHPLMAECRRVSDGKDSTLTGEKVTCAASSGSNCLNAEQSDGSCDDYEVRFLCPRDESKWTAWLNRDSPGGNGDGEHLALLQQEYGVCARPLGAECRRVSDAGDYTQTGELVTCNAADGAVCLNADQADQQCDDYQVRFYCP